MYNIASHETVHIYDIENQPAGVGNMASSQTFSIPTKSAHEPRKKRTK
jgi:hypothetical protein